MKDLSSLNPDVRARLLLGENDRPVLNGKREARPTILTT